MIKTIKMTKKLTLLELLQKFDAGEVPRGKYKTGYGNWVSFDVNRKIKFSQNNFINHRLSDAYEVEVEEPIMEDMEFECVVINTEGLVYSFRYISIKESRDKLPKAVEIFARIDGRLQKIWERDADE